jgi:phosphatidylserine/phosphatidylglycerophosphate/cardiolipin synthase-like enzyme
METQPQPPDFEVSGTNAAALFTLKIFRGEGMALLGMNWREGEPPNNFVGFEIQYAEPGSTTFFALKNRLNFLDKDGNVVVGKAPTTTAPIQLFRWAHFPFHAGLKGLYTYKVTPVFMDGHGVLTYGEVQLAAISLANETYPGELNVAFTRGFVSSQAFIGFAPDGKTDTLLPTKADKGLTFKATAQNAETALTWMGFEARAAILQLLKDAVDDEDAQVRVTAYDLNEPIIVDLLVKMGTRLQIIIDDSGTHGDKDSAESQAEELLVASAGRANVQRQHVGGLQHNKTIAVGGKVLKAVGGSTNFSWRGLYVQNNNAVILTGQTAVDLFFEDFENLFNNPNKPGKFAATNSANWNDLKLPSVKAKIAFSPHNDKNAVLAGITKDIDATQSSLLFSLAFLYQTPGPLLNTINNKANTQGIFVYGISDKKVGGIDIKSPTGNKPATFPARLLKNVPQPFKEEASGGGGVRMHHKFVVIDFDKPEARVYLGSYNFSVAADQANGENLIMIQDRRVAVSYMVEALVMFDHYDFRNAIKIAEQKDQKIYLKTPPTEAGTDPWWKPFFTNPQKISDRLLFS